MNEKEIAEKLSGLDNVEIGFSMTTKKFFVSLRKVEIKEGNFLKSVGYHADTPQEALDLTLTALILADSIVKDAYGDRVIYKWDGNKFEKVN